MKPGRREGSEVGSYTRQLHPVTCKYCGDRCYVARRDSVAVCTEWGCQERWQQELRDRDKVNRMRRKEERYGRKGRAVGVVPRIF